MTTTRPRVTRLAAASRHPIAWSAGLMALSPAMFLVEAPRWLGLLMAVLMAACSLVVGLAQAVLPQDSPDRLAWWKEWLRHRERMSVSQGRHSAAQSASAPHNRHPHRP